MFKKILHKFNNLADHHQVAFAILAILGIVCFTWGIEKILDYFIIHEKSLTSYLTITLFGLLILWFTKHVILHVI